MLANLFRQLVGRAETGAPPAHLRREAPQLAFIRSNLHPLLREGKVSEALIEFAPLLAADAGGSEVRNLLEFAVRGISSLARQDAWRAEITYQLGAILLGFDDAEGAALCAGITWGEADAAKGYRRFERGLDIADYCRAEGLPVTEFPALAVSRMDGLPLARVGQPGTTLCMLRNATVIGESFLPATAEGIVFTERSTDNPRKLDRFDGAQWLDMTRLASDGALWAAAAETDRHAGAHVLVGNHDNIGHWLLFYLSRLRLLEDMPALRDAKVIVGESVRPLHLECLRRAGVDESRLVRLRKGRYAQFDELWVPSLICGVSGQEILYWTPEAIHFVRRTLGVAPPAGGGRRRVFLSRRGARWRRLLNEDEVLAALAREGFEEVDAGKLGLQQQISLAAETSAIVGCFGAGMNFHLFAGEGVPVLQLQPEERVRMNIHPLIARALKQPFRAVVGEVKNRDPNPLKSDFEVAPGKILEALAGVLDHPAGSR